MRGARLRALGSRHRLAATGTAVLLALSACSSSEPTASPSSPPSTVAASSAPQDTSSSARCTPPAQGAGYTPTGTLVADSGFRPEKDSLAFENYGVHVCDESAKPLPQPALNLGPAEMRRLFGDLVCGSDPSDTCDLTPPAAAWMKEWNANMSGGHCYGFSVTAQLLHSKKIALADFGGGASAVDLPVTPALQHEIAYNFPQQILASVRNATVKGTPSEILAKLRAVLTPDATESYTIVLFKRDGDGGHAVTPYAVEDNGNGKFHVLIYDNNYPKVTRAIEFDTQADTWSYDAATNPNAPSELYEGDATTKSLALKPVSPGLSVQPAPFGGTDTAGDTANRGGGVSAGLPQAAGALPATSLEQISLNVSSRGEHPHLLVTAPDGKRTGFVDGKLVNEIGGAQVEQPAAADDWKDSTEPTYLVPDGQAYKVTVDATGLASPETVGVEVIGPGFDIGVDNIALEGGDTDVLSFEPGATKVSYTTSRNESPTIQLGVTDDKADYAFTAYGVDVPGGGTIALELPIEGTDLTLSSTGAGTYALQMDRTDKAGTKTFKHDKINLAANDTATLQFGAWDSDGQTIPLVVDHGGTKQTTQLSDEPAATPSA